MSTRAWLVSEPVGEYIAAHTTPADPVVADIRAATVAAAGRMSMMQIGDDQFVFMELLARAMGARRAIEIGTFTGTSALAVAKGMGPEGRLLCCDVSEEWTSIARRYWERAGVADRIELQIAPALETLQALPSGRELDFAFIDADKTGYASYFEEIVARVRPGGLIVLDNMLRDGRVLDPENDDDRAIHALNDALLADDRVDVVLLPVRDGVSLARVR
jgi:caffeoyl-CoA O-methyltransferase